MSLSYILKKKKGKRKKKKDEPFNSMYHRGGFNFESNTYTNKKVIYLS